MQVPSHDPFLFLSSTMVDFLGHESIANFTNIHIPLLVTFSPQESMHSLLSRLRVILEALYIPLDPLAYWKAKQAQLNNPPPPKLPIQRDRLRRSLFFSPFEAPQDAPFPFNDEVAVVLRPLSLSRLSLLIFESLSVVSLETMSIEGRDCTQPAASLLSDLARVMLCEFWSLTVIVRARASPQNPLLPIEYLQTLSTAKLESILQSVQRKLNVQINLLIKQRGSASGATPIRLEDCLQRSIASTATEVCDNCGEKAPRDLQTRITQLPPLLVILLKRFAYDFQSSGSHSYCGYRHKINDLVSFPLEGLDMAPYSFGCESTLYDLIGVCNHTGSADCGHYYAYAKNETRGTSMWYEFNDSFVHSIASSAVQTECAYYLVYRKRSQPLLETVNETIRTELAAMSESIKSKSFSYSRKTLASSFQPHSMPLSAVSSATSMPSSPSSLSPSPIVDSAKSGLKEKTSSVGRRSRWELDKKKGELQSSSEAILLDSNNFPSPNASLQLDLRIERQCRRELITLNGS